jgi:hypothetical protein
LATTPSLFATASYLHLRGSDQSQRMTAALLVRHHLGLRLSRRSEVSTPATLSLLPLFSNDRLIAREDRRHPRPSDHPAREQTEFQYVFIVSGIGSISTATAS